MKKTINELFVYTSGNTENKPIIFIHGFPYDHTMWRAQINNFSGDYFCIAYDIRGLGNSPAGNGQFTMESFVDDLERIMTELELKKPIICGLSMGGYLTLRALERMPGQFYAAILCDTKSESDNNEGKLKRAAGIKRINAEGLEPFAREFITNCFGDKYRQNNQEELNQIIEKSSRFDPVGVKGSLLAMLGRNDTTPGLEKISIPTMLICGEKDSLTPPAVMKQMQTRIPNAGYMEISNSGHMTPIENSREFNSAMSKFLSELRA